MTAADKLRELIATRPGQPSLEELVRWWATSAVLMLEVLDELEAAWRASGLAHVRGGPIDVRLSEIVAKFKGERDLAHEDIERQRVELQRLNQLLVDQQASAERDLAAMTAARDDLYAAALEHLSNTKYPPIAREQWIKQADRAFAVGRKRDREDGDSVHVECGSCRGYGHFSKHGKPSTDKRDRKCLDCGGEGRVTAS